MGGAVRGAVTLMMWGSVLIALDVEINGIDVLNDAFGALVLLVAVADLRRAVTPPAHPALDLAGAAAFVLLPIAVYDTVVSAGGSTLPAGVEMLSHAVTIVGLLALAHGMRTFFEDVEHEPLLRTWATTFRLLLFLVAIPTAIVGAAVLATGSVRRRFEADLSGPVVLLVLVLVAVAVVPFVHLLVAMVRTRRLAGALDVGAPPQS